MNTNDIITFFNSVAPSWDSKTIYNPQVMETIVNYCGISEGDSVLDIACGTGFMFPFYLEKKASFITGIDISDKMICIGREKFKNYKNIELICGDANTHDFGRKYDRIVIFNALPHFEDFKKLFNHLNSFLKKGGTFSIAHSMSRTALKEHHKNVMHISQTLPEADELSALIPDDIEIKYSISDDEKYIVSGIKK